MFSDKIIIDLSDIIIASPINGITLQFSTNNDSYLVKGHKRFNPLKYVLMFNRLETSMKSKKIDKYYTLV